MTRAIRSSLAFALILAAMLGLARADEGDRQDTPGEGSERPGKLDPLFDRINPAEFQRLFDRIAGLDTGDRSDKPAAPDIPEPVFFDVTRPLDDFKYANELNYLYNSSTGNAPALQVIEYEYVFADWRSTELDLSYFNGNLQIITPFYQRTLGVGRRGNWAHGYQLSLDIYQRSGFLGGSPTYVFSWKSDRESKFSLTTFLGANRALINGFNTASNPAAAPSSMSSPARSDVAYGAWRPMVNVDLFYKLSEKWTLGLENDLFLHRGEAGEYLSFPFLTYEPGKHAFFQLGGGYYHYESRDQFTFFLHVNLVNPSTRRPREENLEDDEEGESGTARGFLGRLFRSRRNE